MEIKIRKALASDIPTIMKLVHELAEFEKQPDEVKNTEEQMLLEGFGPNPAFYALLAEANGKVCGMSVYFYSYSTWKGKSIYIDDVIVNESYRGKGIGRKLMEATIMVAKEEGVGKLHWQVLDWNEPAIKFYNKYNPSFDPEWINCAIAKDQLSLLNY
ncbi:MAG: GNAT family N-acetyltransferase [Opitutaceae bacterium]|nr:GNAT family N-acetyltransferase [Cytophagales bacterium]